MKNKKNCCLVNWLAGWLVGIYLPGIIIVKVIACNRAINVVFAPFTVKLLRLPFSLVTPVAIVVLEANSIDRMGEDGNQ